MVEHVCHVATDGSADRTHIEGVTCPQVQTAAERAPVRLYDIHLFAEAEVRAGEGVVAVVAVIERVFAAYAEAFEGFEEDTEVSGGLRLSAYMDTFHVYLRPCVVGCAYLGALSVRRHREAVFVIGAAYHAVAIPFPVAYREHSAQLQPFGRTGFGFELDTHMARIDARHVHIEPGLVRVAQVAVFGHALVHPFGEIAVHVDRSVLVLEPVTDLHGSDLLVLGFVIDGIGGADRHVYRLVFRRTADKAGVEEDVVPFGELVIDTSLDSTADAYHRVACGDVVVVVAVLAPVMVEAHRAVDEGGEVVLAVFQAAEESFLYDSTCIVAVGDVAHAEFLVHPCVVVAFGVVLRQDGRTVGVDIITAAEEVADHRLVDTLVPPYVHAGGQLQTVEEFLIVGRDESHPVVVVSVLADDEFRPVFGGGIDLLHHAVVEHAGDGVAEGGCHHAVVCTPCEVAIAVSRVQSVLGGASEAASDRGIYGSGQAAEVVNLPYVVETDLRLVVLVVVRTRLLAAFVASVGRVVLAAVHAGGHVLRHAVPFRQRQRARRARRTGPVPLRSTETGEGELVVLVDSFGDIGEIAVSLESRSLDISVTPRAASHDGNRPAADRWRRRTALCCSRRFPWRTRANRLSWRQYRV